MHSAASGALLLRSMWINALYVSAECGVSLRRCVGGSAALKR